MEDLDEYDFSEVNHDRLISAVSKLDKTQHIKQPTRNEPTNLSSEFNLIKSNNKLDISSVVKVLENTSTHVRIGKKLKKTQDISKVLPKPLEKPQAERIKRATGYEESKNKVSRWDPVVARSRSLDYVSFPLKHAGSKLQPTSEFLSKFKLKSDLELELEEVDPPPPQEEEKEEEQSFPMTYQEMVEHRQHLAKIRAQQSYKAAKAKRIGKIKSKKYHRILKKEKLKQQIKEFEELQKTDPEEALKKLESLEKARALERHTLRHKNTGKWAKNLLVRAKYDKEVRQQLAEQLAVSRGLTKKTLNTDSTDDEDDNNVAIPDMDLAADPSNPWMLKSANKSNVDAEFDFGYKKYLKDRMIKNKIDTESDTDTENDKIDDAVKETEVIESSQLKETKNLFEDLLLQENINRMKEREQKAEDSTVKNNVSEKLNKPQKKTANKKNKLKHTKPKKDSSKLVATSSWVVEPADEQTEPNETENITEVFETLENSIIGKVEKKLKSLRKNLEYLERRPKEQKSNENISTKVETDSLEYLSFKNNKTKASIDEQLNETSSKILENLQETDKSVKKLMNIATNVTNEKTPDSNIDPTRFIEAKPKYLNTAISEQSNFDQLDDDDEQVVPKVNIEEVFEEDDVVASFRQEKEDEANKNQPQDINLSLPGWGSWGGKGVKAQKRKNNRFILKAPPKMPRRDENKGDIIIKEYKDPKLSAHKVTDIPFPFTSVKEYEASIRAPLGNTFIPEKAHKKLIRPAVITKAGTIIEPMDEEELLIPKNIFFNKHKKTVIKIAGK